MFPPPTFFPGAKLNFAENLLFPAEEVDEQGPALIAATEVDRETITWAQLRQRVAECQAGLKAVNLKIGDRVAGYCGNHANAIVAMLAATSLGAIWTGISPDSGTHMVLDRLKLAEPVVLFTDDQQYYNGKRHNVMSKVKDIVSQLPSLHTIVITPTVREGNQSDNIELANGKVYHFSDFTKLAPAASPMHFEQLPPDQPVYILYSSGTTGAPKAIVHGAIGTLIQHKKEHVLHCSIVPGARLFYFTTCTWMMWHWLVSGLASGATLILYDGSPMRYRGASPSADSVADDLAMPRLIDELGINHFGTSAKYLSVLEQKSAFPKPAGLSLSTLQAVYNTASPLGPSTFRYVYRAFGPDINLASITGGTDIISLFGAGSPLVPVYAGEVQAPGLGMSIRAWDESGTDITATGAPGDLVCTRAFPCQPVAFWGPGGAEKYRSSYFTRFPGVWHHGDFVQFNPRTTGLVMLGRSDGVLNPAGVRFGSAEIYNVVLSRFPDRVADALCVGRRRQKDDDETVVLFVKMAEGDKWDEKLVRDIKISIRSELSARHVPGIVDECPDIPVTVNGKK